MSDTPSCPHCGHQLPRPELRQRTFNLTETGKILGWSRWTIKALIKAGQLAAIPRRRPTNKGTCRAWRVADTAIEAYIEKYQAHNREALRRALDARVGMRPVQTTAAQGRA